MTDHAQTDAPVHPDLESEQAYLYFAYDCLEAMRRFVEQLLTLEVGANAYTQEVVHATLAERLVDLERDQSLCFGRIDRTDGDRYYIGRRHVRDQAGDPVVVDWRAPVAEAFYQANAADPFGLDRRRSFLTEGPRLLGIDDEVFAELAAARKRGVPEALIRAGDALLAEIGRERTGRMRDVVATIQAEQDRLIRLPADGVVVVQGAPGTGKTAVGLHRAAFLLYQMREARVRGGVLVVGPNRAFMRYIERVLPSLGETTVVQSAVDELASIQVRAEDPPSTLRVKGDPRMVELIGRAVRQRTRPGAARRDVKIGTRSFTLTEGAATRMIDAAFATGLPYRDARDVFVASAASLLAREAFGAPNQAQEREQARVDLSREASFRGLMDRMWPSVSAADVIRDLFGTRTQLMRASEGLFDPREVEPLLRRPAARLADERWTRGDVALVDEAQWRIAGVPRTYSHVIVDEIQDLSPMELRMIARRASTGAMTLLGDLAQSIGEWSYDDWGEVVAHLPKAGEPRFMELTIGYRVPRQMIEMASRLLPSIAPTLAPPVAIRDGEPPTLVRAAPGRLVHQVIREMRDAFGLEGSVGVLVPDGRRHEVEAAARAAHIEFDGPDWGRGRKLTVMSSREAKGMEFDHVLLVEPAELLTGDARGRRELYVALTRATQTLRIVHAMDVPAELGALPLAG